MIDIRSLAPERLITPSGNVRHVNFMDWPPFDTALQIDAHPFIVAGHLTLLPDEETPPRKAIIWKAKCVICGATYETIHTFIGTPKKTCLSHRSGGIKKHTRDAKMDEAKNNILAVLMHMGRFILADHVTGNMPHVILRQAANELEREGRIYKRGRRLIYRLI